MKRFFAFKKMISLMLALAFAASLAGCTQRTPETAQPETTEADAAAGTAQPEGSVNSELTQLAEEGKTVSLKDIQWTFIGDEIYFDYFERVATPEQKAELEEAEPIDGMHNKLYWKKKILQILGIIPEDLPHLTIEQALAVCEKLDPNDYEGPNSWERAVVIEMDKYAVTPDYDGEGGITIRRYLIDDVPTGYISVFGCGVTYRDLVNGTEEVLYKYNDHLDIQEP